MSQIIAFQGFSGAYHEQAALEVFPDAKTLPCETFDDTFKAAQDGAADLAIIAVDNTLAGRVADVHRLLPKSNLHIVGETFLPIRHALIGLKGAKIEQLTDIHSHIHALPQCQNIIKELGLTKHVQTDTAGAAKNLITLNDPTQCAIASSLAAKIYNLEVLKEDIQDADHNTTRFLFVSKNPDVPAYDPKKKYITTFIFEVRNMPAALYKAMGGFATNNVNMVKLESYIGENFQAAEFYADVVGHPEERPLQLALEELGFFAKEVQLLGVYEAHKFRKL